MPPTLSLRHRLRFLRSSQDPTPIRDVESQTPDACVSPLPESAQPCPSSTSISGVGDSKTDLQTEKLQEDAPPAYGDIGGQVQLDSSNEKAAPAPVPVAGLHRMQSQALSIVTNVSRPGDGDVTTNSPIIETTTHNNMPTIMVLVKEDYVWARAFLKEFDYKKAARRATAKHLYKWYALLIIIITISVLVSTKHTTIVEFCRPVTERIRNWPGGWLIPIALLVIVSFPPLVGHEIIGILCGLVWGMWIGFGILAAGTFLGEVATWVVFKWMCTSRARKFERKNKLYAALTQLIREKSFTFVLILRFSAIPGHIVTAVSASAGANVWSYLAAAFLTLPKQAAITYLGTSFGNHSKKDTYVSWGVTILTFLGTIVAAVYVYYQMRVLFRTGRMDDRDLPHGDPRIPAGWADVEAAGADGVGSGMRVDYEDKGHVRRSVDVIFGPHARAQALEARRAQLLAASKAGGRTPGRTRSLPGPITEDEMRSWLAQLDTALLACTATSGPAPLRPETIPEEEETKTRARSYSQTLLLSPPVAATPPNLGGMIPEGGEGLPDLAHEHIVLNPAPSDAGAGSRPASGTVPAILLTPTYTPARSRANTQRGTRSLELERPSSADLGLPDLGVENEMEHPAVTAVKRDLAPGRRRGYSSAASGSRPRAESRASVLLVRPRSDSVASTASAGPTPSTSAAASTVALPVSEEGRVEEDKEDKNEEGETRGEGK